jgi:hypothetical protein
MEKRTKLALSRDKMYKALGEGERTSKKVASIRMSDGSTFKRKNANQYGTAEGGNDYTEKRSNRTDRFDLGGTADSSNTGANMGGTMGSSIMKHGGSTIKDNNRMYNFLKDDLVGLEAATKEMPFSKEEIERFFSYWGTHLKSLKTKTNDRMYNFLKDDLKKLEKAINDNNIEEIDIFFSYWNQHLESLKMKKGGKLIGKQKNLDLNKNGKLDSEDFKMIRGNKKANGGLADVPESFPNNDAVSYKTGGKVDAKDYFEQLAVYVQGVGSIYNGTSMKKAIDKANSYLKKNAKAEIVISDEKYGDTYDLNGNMTEEDEMANGGTTKGFEYTIGGL